MRCDPKSCANCAFFQRRTNVGSVANARTSSTECIYNHPARPTRAAGLCGRWEYKPTARDQYTAMLRACDKDGMYARPDGYKVSMKSARPPAYNTNERNVHSVPVRSGCAVFDKTTLSAGYGYDPTHWGYYPDPEED